MNIKMKEDKINILEEYYIKVTRLVIWIIIFSISCGTVTILIKTIFTEKNRYIILFISFIVSNLERYYTLNFSELQLNF